jgi:2-C-methyl-D-erythritol 4-phosphate cytidylyltransferase
MRISMIPARIITELNFMSNIFQEQHFAIIPAAGSGRRMGAAIPKQYLMVQGKTILEYSIQALLNISFIKQIVVVLAPNDGYWKKLPASLIQHPRILTAVGGNERQESVLNGLMTLRSALGSDDWILVHDAARPCLVQCDVFQLAEKLAQHPIGGLLGAPVRDTLKRCSPEGAVQETVSRQNLWHALTPQMFRYRVLLDALHSALSKQQTVTDEASAIELVGRTPLMVPGRADNIKVTMPEDLLLVERFFQLPPVS